MPHGFPGPSLRVQGELNNVHIAGATTRAIPARAGRTGSPRSGCPCRAGHPCACRENNLFSLITSAPLGPSLRVQGERSPAGSEHGARPGHPCACRENTESRMESPQSHGPSLRVQGERSPIHRARFHPRAIPARAGRTLGHGSVSTHTPGHPCACRENVTLLPNSSGLDGPSLRVQGEPNIYRGTTGGAGAIPARAGRTGTGNTSVSWRLGHPCACRENCTNGQALPIHVGPSLRVQGEPNHLRYLQPQWRAIPARAGRTRCQNVPNSRGQGHPCACRENSMGG